MRRLVTAPTTRTRVLKHDVLVIGLRLVLSYRSHDPNEEGWTQQMF